jgi:P4 family phage/plasmid primase-like protien
MSFATLSFEDQVSTAAKWHEEYNRDLSKTETAIRYLADKDTIKKVLGEIQRRESITPQEPNATFLEPFDTLGYLRSLYEPGDWLDCKLIHETRKYTDKNGIIKAETRDNFQSLEQLLQPATLDQIVDLQNDGWHVYITMNAFINGVTRRLKKNVAAIRTVYVEFDENGEAGLDKIDADVKAGLVPEPHFILESSPGKYYVIWRVTGFDVRTQEALNRALVQRYGSDPQSVDASRVLRLPGSYNIKSRYNPKPRVEIVQEAPGERFTPQDFKVEREVPAEVDRKAAPEKVQMRMGYYEQACEDAGVDAGDLVAKDDGSYNYVVACPNYEEHTTGGEFDASVWISPSGAISFACFHSHCAGKDWKTFYRPWLEEQAVDNGYKGKLKFGEAREVEGSGLVLQMSNSVQTEPSVPVEAVPTETSSGRLAVADIFDQLNTSLTGREMPWQHGAAADFFSMLFGDNYRYAVLGKTGDWMTWNGHMWHPGNIAAMLKRIDGLLSRIRTQIIPGLTAADGNMLLVLRGLEKKCANADFMSGVLRMLQSKLLTNFAEFDPEGKPPLVNFINGTYELETGVFRESRREDMLTQTMPVAYTPNARCPTWLTFLENSFPERDVREFLQRFFGYMLEGTGKEKLAAFFHGYGDNGKTMLMAVLTSLFGFKSDNAYGKSVGWETFAENKTGQIRNDIARLHNARAVFCDESEQGMVLKESVFKALTGSSPITSRFLHKEFFTFFSRFVFVLATNRLPSVKGGDGASWARILKIPMTQSFPVGHPKRIEGLKALLMGEREGIAAWMVEGYKKYKTDGLKIPASIKEASAEYRENSDVIESFLTEVCTRDSASHELFDVVYSRYILWCKRMNEKEQNRDSFIDNLKARGYDVKRQMNRVGRPRYVLGLRLNSEDERPVNQLAMSNTVDLRHSSQR